MRDRSEILSDATTYTDSKTLVPEDTDKLRLLTLEVMVDIRDILNDYLPVIDGHLLHHSQGD